MPDNPAKPVVQDVPAQVFEGFLAALTAAGTPPDVTTRLRDALLKTKAFDESSLKTAVFGDE